MPIAPPLIGTYPAPAVKRGEVVTCLYRDRDCTITTMSNAPIPWPRCQPRGEQGGSGLWVNAELARAIKTESAAALKHWFGVSAVVVWKWRKAFGVGGRATTKGSKRAIREAAKQGAAAMKAKVRTPAELRAKSRRSKRLKLKPTGCWKGKEWTLEQLALLGIDHDEAIAKKLGRTRSAVTSQRVHRKIPAFSGSPGGGRAWSAEELALLGTDRDAAVAEKVGRTRGAVSQKRLALKMPVYRDSRRGRASPKDPLGQRSR
jgi:transposase-like protein